MEDEIRFVEMGLIDPPGEASRDIIDPERINELAQSIRSQGLLQPVLLRSQNGRFEIVAGHRRFLAHSLLGEVRIKAICKEMTDEEVILVRAIENDQREDLNPIEKAKNYRRLQTKFGWSSREISVKMGKHRNTIDKYLHLLEIPDEFQEAVAKGKLAMQVALELIKIEDPAARKYHFEAAVNNGITYEVAVQWVVSYEQTRLNIAHSDDGGMGVQGDMQPSLPIYQPCFTCLGPVEISKLRMIYVCPICLKRIQGALADEK